jgi:hypothetical protein
MNRPSCEEDDSGVSGMGIALFMIGSLVLAGGLLLVLYGWAAGSTVPIVPESQWSGGGRIPRVYSPIAAQEQMICVVLGAVGLLAGGATALVGLAWMRGKR